jgi:O-antigen/teichoic acid export membrane protein
MTYYTTALLFSALFLSFFGKEILFLFSKNLDYLPAYTVIPFIAMAFVFRGMQYNISLSFHFSKKTGINAVIIVATAILNIALNFLFVPRFGFIGSGISMCVSFLVMLIISIKPAQKNYEIPYEKKKLYGLLSLAFTAFIIYFFVESLYISQWIKVLIKMGLILLTIISLFPLNIITKRETKYLLNKIGLGYRIK